MGSVHYCAEDEVFYGKIEGIEDLVSFEAKSVDALKTAFQESVEDYLDICERNNKNAEKSYKGSFNVRIPPELHKKAKRMAVKMGLSLNQFVQKVLEDELAKEDVLN
ncbi:MAG: type II toxin-antitoxin system HicB family antitoxin [Spirochaetia bacterium]|jgi:predicted HicB family RNase H-like nuclease|nr:type II toxin-antitoxin system HicB family antitoxin [Spirochaetia bacterium]